MKNLFFIIWIIWNIIFSTCIFFQVEEFSLISESYLYTFGFLIYTTQIKTLRNRSFLLIHFLIGVLYLVLYYLVSIDRIDKINGYETLLFYIPFLLVMLLFNYLSIRITKKELTSPIFGGIKTDFENEKIKISDFIFFVLFISMSFTLNDIFFIY